MFTRVEFKLKAKEVLKRNYWTCFLVTLVTLILGGAGPEFTLKFGPSSTSEFDYYFDSIANIFGLNMISRFVDFAFIAVPILMGMLIVGLLFNLFVVNVLEVGKKKFFLEARENRYEFKTIGFAFQHPGYLNIVKIMFFQKLYVFLWTLLFVIPGIIASYRYRFINFIIAENPEIGMQEAFDLSREMTNGIKMDLFILDLSFFGWYLLNMISFGLATFFVGPYPEATDAEVYRAYQNKMNTSF